MPVSMPVMLLVYLALQDDWVGRGHLATLFWPEAAEGAARRNLRRLISRLSEVPFAGEVEIAPDRLRWTAHTDVHEFRRALGRGDWQLATETYAGPLLAGFEAAGEGLATWLELERAGLFAGFKDAAYEHIVALDAAEEFEAAAGLAARVLAHDSVAEEFVRLRMRAAFLAGNRFEALQVFSSFSELLRTELDLEPDVETIRLHQQLTGTDGSDFRPARYKQLVPVELLRPPSLVGRDAEVRRLESSGAHPVLIIGEPGVGKTRLLWTGTPDNTLYCRSRAELSLVPFHSLTRLISSRLTQGIPLPNMGAYQADLETLLHGTRKGPAAAGGERSRLLEAAARYLEQSGTMVLFDDLQWADTATLELLLYLNERENLPIRGAYRTDEISAALGRTLDSLVDARIIRLAPLDATAMGQLLTSLTGRKEPPDRFAAWLQQLTAGNPLFALETLRSLFEARVLRLEDDDWRTPIDTFTTDYSELPAAAAVRDVIRRRISRLSEFAQRVLRAVAVLGDHATPGWLSQLTALDDWAVLAAAEEASAAGLLNGTVFAHDLMRHTVYSDTGLAIRSHLHREAAKLFEDSLVKASHLAAAGDHPAAVPLWIDAHQQLMLQGLYDEALAVLDAIEKCDDDGHWMMEVLTRRASTLHGLSEPERASELAAQVLRGTTDPVLRASAHNTMAGAQLMLGNLSQAEFHAQSGVDILADDSGLAVELAHLRANALFHQGRIDDADSVLVPLVERVRAKGPEVQLPGLLTSLGSIRDEQQRQEEGLALHREAHLGAAALGQRHVQVSAILNMLYCLIDLGRPEEGLELAEQALALGRFGSTDALRANLAAAYRACGQLQLAAAHYVELSGTTSDPSLRCVAWTNLARLAHESGNRADVARFLASARADVKLTGFPTMRARVAVALVLYGGSASDLELARDILVDIDDSTVPHWLKDDLKQARELL